MLNETDFKFWVSISRGTRLCELELYADNKLVERYQGGCLDLDREFAAGDEKEIVTLRAVRQRLIDYELNKDEIFQERGQMDVGQQLSSQVFGSEGEERMRRLLDEAVDLRIVTDDEEVAGLPWSLLYSNMIFPASNKWSVALSECKENCADWILPPSPKILIIAPTPLDDGRPIQTEEHLDQLEFLLSASNKLYRRNHHLQCVGTYEEFLEKLTSYEPDIIYYYGHGEGNWASSHLIFASAAGDSRRVPVADLAHVLRQLREKAPVMAYMNCCLGGAGGLLGVIGQLGNFVPAVITNCTTAYVDAARDQALSIWKKILVEGRPPHEAVARTRTNLIARGLSFRDLRWMTPVLHCSYRDWSHTLPPPKDFVPSLRWEHKLDREAQFGRVLSRAEVNFQGKNSLAFMVYGRPGQGIQALYERIQAELPEKLKFEFLKIIDLNWPPLALDEKCYLTFKEQFREFFDLETIEEIGAKLAAELRNRPSTSNVIFIRYTPIELGLDQAIVEAHLTRLKSYLDWLDQLLIPRVPPNVRLIIAISFIVPEHSRPPTSHRRRRNWMNVGSSMNSWLQLLRRARGIGNPNDSMPGALDTPEFKVQAEELENSLCFPKLEFVVLEELGPVERKDLEAFIKDNQIPLPQFGNRNHIDEILNDTHGLFEAVLAKVKHLNKTAWELGH